MNPDLVALKQRVLDAEKEYLAWAAANTAGQPTERLVAIDIGYRKACRAYSDAMDAYSAALAEAAR